MAPKTLYLVDGSTYIYRAFFAMPSFTNDEGMPTGAIYGFTNMLLKLVRDEAPDYLAVVFDKSSKTFRNELYPDYKANRPPTPEDLSPQLPFVRKVTRAMNVPALETEGFEADDIIATLAKRAQDEGFRTVVVTSDKDMMQLVQDDSCSLLDTMKQIHYRADEVHAKMGVWPHQIIDYLALLGDSVDNIPGVPGVGKKTASLLLESYGNLEGIYEHIDEQKGKRRENLVTFKEQAFLARKLATVRFDAPVDIPLADLKVQEPNKSELTELFAHLGFKTLHRQFHDSSALDETPNLLPQTRTLVRTEEELSQLVMSLAAEPKIALAPLVEMSMAGPPALVGISLSTSDRGWYIPTDHRTLDAHPQISPPKAMTLLKPLLGDSGPRILVHDSKSAWRALSSLNVRPHMAFDTMLASYLIDAGKYAHTLSNIALNRLNHKGIERESVLGKGKTAKTWSQCSPEAVHEWACEQSQLIFVLSEALEEDLEAAELAPLLYDMEMPLSLVLGDMESRGILANIDGLKQLSAELRTRASDLEAEAHRLAGEPFSLGSPKQLGHVLFDVIGLTPTKKTKTGYSTNVTVLEALSQEHPLPALVLQWRSVTKLRSTYTEVLPTLVRDDSGRIHTCFNQAVAATGRLSSNDPNLQNIPVRTPDGQRIRQAFIAPKDHVLLSADYSQIELRVLAHLAQDEAMQQAFRDGADIHRRTASELFELDEEEVSRDQRAMAKTINFGILYGMSAFRLAREQGISRPHAKAIIQRYFERYPGINAWKAATLESAQRDGYVSTLAGRIRKIPEIRAKNAMVRQAAERMAINTPVQGTAADIIKAAMVHIDAHLPSAVPSAAMILQVHDELVFEVPAEDVESLATFVTRAMEDIVELDVPLVANAGYGLNWLDAH